MGISNLRLTFKAHHGRDHYKRLMFCVLIRTIRNWIYKDFQNEEMHQNILAHLWPSLVWQFYSLNTQSCPCVLLWIYRMYTQFEGKKWSDSMSWLTPPRILYQSSHFIPGSSKTLIMTLCNIWMLKNYILPTHTHTISWPPTQKKSEEHWGLCKIMWSNNEEL